MKFIYLLNYQYYCDQIQLFQNDVSLVEDFHLNTFTKRSKHQEQFNLQQVFSVRKVIQIIRKYHALVLFSPIVVAAFRIIAGIIKRNLKAITSSSSSCQKIKINNSFKSQAIGSNCQESIDGEQYTTLYQREYSTTSTAQSSSQDIRSLNKEHQYSRRKTLKKARSIEIPQQLVSQSEKIIENNERVIAESLAIQKILSKNFTLQKQKKSKSFCRRFQKKRLQKNGFTLVSHGQKEQNRQLPYCALAIQNDKRAKLIKKKGGKIGNRLKKALSSIMLPTISQE